MVLSVMCRSWAEEDVDPSLFPRELLANASNFVGDEEVTWLNTLSDEEFAKLELFWFSVHFNCEFNAFRTIFSSIYISITMLLCM